MMAASSTESSRTILHRLATPQGQAWVRRGGVAVKEGVGQCVAAGMGWKKETSQQQ